METRGALEQKAFICSIRLSGIKRCFPGIWEQAILEIQRKHFLTLIEANQ